MRSVVNQSVVEKCNIVQQELFSQANLLYIIETLL